MIYLYSILLLAAIITWNIKDTLSKMFLIQLAMMAVFHMFIFLNSIANYKNTVSQYNYILERMENGYIDSFEYTSYNYYVTTQKSM
jgi:hypothetical protein